MSFAGVHISCFQIAIAGRVGSIGGIGILTGKVLWSESLSAPGTTANAAPTGDGLSERPSFEISPTLDVFVACGPSPDAVNGPRLLVRAGDNRNIVSGPGDKVAWVGA